MNNRSILSQKIPIRRLKKINDREFLDKKLEEIRKKLSQLPKYKPTLQTEYDYLNEDGSIHIQKILQDMVIKPFEFKVDGEYYHSREIVYSNVLQNKNQYFLQILQSFFSRYFLEQDVKSQLVYSYIKSYCQQNVQQPRSSQEWYKLIVNFEDSQSSYEHHKEHIPSFPILSINEEVANAILINLNIHNQVGLPFIPALREDFGGVNFPLIKNVLFADAMGFTKSHDSQKPCVGESIHLRSDQIYSIQAYNSRRKQNNRCFWNPPNNNVNLCCSKNRLLPDWMVLQITDNLIILSGYPQACDIGQLIIKIFSSEKCVIKVIKLNISDDVILDDNPHDLLSFTEQQRLFSDHCNIYSESTTHRCQQNSLTSECRLPFTPKSLSKEGILIEESQNGRKRNSSFSRRITKFAKEIENSNINEVINSKKQIQHHHSPSVKFCLQSQNLDKQFESHDFHQIKEAQIYENQFLKSQKYDRPILSKIHFSDQSHYDERKRKCSLEEDRVMHKSIINSQSNQNQSNFDEEIGHLKSNSLRLIKYNSHKPDFQ